MASDHRGNHVHAGKRTDDEIMANPFYNAGDPLLKKATMARMQNPVPNSKPSSVKAQADEIMGYETGKVSPMVTAKGVKETATNAGNKIANSGYGSAALAGAAAGGVFLGGGINLAAGEAGHPAENLPVMDTPQVAKGMIAGAAIGVAGKLINDARKMPKGSRSQK